MPLYIEKMVEFLDQQGIVGVPGDNYSESGFGASISRGGGLTGGASGWSLNNISLQQVGGIVV